MNKTIKKLLEITFFILAFAIIWTGSVVYALPSEGVDDDASGEEVYVYHIDGVLQEGDLLVEEKKVNKAPFALFSFFAIDDKTSVEDEIKEDILAGWDTFSEKIDLSEYNITPDDFVNIYWSTLNNNPQYFYVTNEVSVTCWNVVEYVEPKYLDKDQSEIENMCTTYETEVVKAMAGADKDKMSDLEKALYINEYICRNCRYDDSKSLENRHNAYGVFGDKIAVCNGYALAFQELSNRLGLECKLVSSKDLNHAWNIVKVDGSWYYVDSTWNDPTWSDATRPDRLGKVGHAYLLESYESFQNPTKNVSVKPHNKNDYTITDNIDPTIANNTKFDNYFWDSIDVGFDYVDGYWYGLGNVKVVSEGPNTAEVTRYRGSNDGLNNDSSLFSISDSWYYTNGGVWSGVYSGTGSHNGKLYFSDTQHVYSYDPNDSSGRKYTEYTLKDDQKNKYYSIFSMNVDIDGNLSILIADNPYEKNGGNYISFRHDVKELGPIKIAKYNVAFNGNGNTAGGMLNMANLCVNGIYNLNKNAYEKTGYIFAGWSTTQDGNVEYEDGANVKNLTTEDGQTLTLYAKWTPIKYYSIEYDGNATDVTGSMSNQTDLAYGRDYNLTDVGYSRTGYTFAGWSKTQDGEVDYEDGASISNLTTEDGQIVTLYAKWTPIKYSIKYDGNATDATGFMPSELNIEYNKSCILRNVYFKRTGYIFAGWSTTQNGEAVYSDRESVRNLTTVDGQTVTLYAKWTPIKYSIKYDGNATNVIGSMSNQTDLVYGESYSLTNVGFSRIGYTFKGWSKYRYDNNVDYEDGANVKNLTTEDRQTVTLYAKWTSIKYSIEYDKNAPDATGNMSKQTNLEYFMGYDLSTVGYSRTGYRFSGWSTTPNGDVVYTNRELVINLTEEDGQTITLYAKWSPIYYSVRYNKNATDATGYMSDQSNLEYNKSYMLSNIGFSRTGYTFAGWSTTQNGDVVYRNRQLVSNLTEEDGQTITLYAKWTKNQDIGGDVDLGNESDAGGNEAPGNGYGESGNTAPENGSGVSGNIAPENGNEVSGNTAPGNGSGVSGNIAPGNGSGVSGNTAPGSGNVTGGSVAPENASETGINADTEDYMPVLLKKTISIGSGEKVYVPLESLKGMKFISSNPKVAQVNAKGQINGKKVGSAKITITGGGKSVLLKVTVAKKPNKVSFSKKELKVKRGKKSKLKVKLPKKTASYNLTYASNRPSIVRVDKTTGQYVALKKGTAVIKVKTYNGKTAKIKVKVD